MSIAVPPVLGASQLVVLDGGAEPIWWCPVCGERNASPEVLLHAKDCPIEARIVAALVAFDVAHQVHA